MAGNWQRSELTVKETQAVIGSMFGHDLAHYAIVGIKENGDLLHSSSFANRSGEIAALANTIDSLAEDIYREGDLHEPGR